MKVSLIKQNAKYFKALGHAKRLEIICLLQCHQLTVNQIVQMTLMRQAAVSQHLILLKDLGLVCADKMGKEIYYSLCVKSFTELSTFAKQFTRLTPFEDVEPTVIDPICHMHLTPSVASHSAEYDGVRHYFCGKGCLQEFTNLHRGTV